MFLSFDFAAVATGSNKPPKPQKPSGYPSHPSYPDGNHPGYPTDGYYPDKPIEIIDVIEVIEVCPNIGSHYTEYDEPVIAAITPENVTFVSQLKVIASDAFEIQFNDSSRGVLCSNDEATTFDEDEDENEDTELELRGLGGGGGGGYGGGGGGGYGGGGHGHGGAVKPCKIVSGWSCPKIGFHKHPTHCQKYVHCKLCRDNAVHTCGHDDAYDGKRCTSDWSGCGELDSCARHGHLLRDPWNKHGYFICWHRKGFKKMRVYRRECYHRYHFNVHKQTCVRPKYKAN